MTEETALINRMKDGDEKALSLLYDKYAGALYGVILRMCRNEALAQDLLQETFIKMWKKAKSYDAAKGRFYTWAFRIARNTTLNALRKEPHLIQIDSSRVYKVKEDDHVEEKVFNLNGVLKKLEEHHKRAIELVYFRGLTHREAHKHMDVPLGTFKSYVRQALLKLRELHRDTLIIIWLIVLAIL